MLGPYGWVITMRFEPFYNRGFQCVRQHSLEGGSLLGKTIQLGGLTACHCHRLI